MSYVSKNLVNQYIDSQGWEHHDHTKKMMKEAIHYLMNRRAESRVIGRKVLNNAIARINPDYTPSNLVAALENKGLFKIASCRNKIDYKPLVENLTAFHEEKVLAEAANHEAAREAAAREAAAQEVVARFPAKAGELILVNIATGGLERQRNENAQARALVSKYLPKYFVGDKEVSTELASRLRSELGYELVVTDEE